MKRVFSIAIIAGTCMMSCEKPANRLDNNRAEAAETPGQKDKDNAETNAEAEADTLSQGGQSATGRQNQKPDEQFAMQAAEAGLTEVKLGTLAESQASNSEVKAFARMMVKDHTAANNELKSLAGAKGLTVPTDCEKCQQKFSELKALKGQAFDKKYIEMMVADHKDAVSKFTTQSSQGGDSELKSWAAGKLPTLKHHLSSAESLNKQTTAKNSCIVAGKYFSVLENVTLCDFFYTVYEITDDQYVYPQWRSILGECISY
jgi:putative membrane protein